MTLKYSVEAQNSMGNGLLTFIDSGSAYPSPYIEIRTAPRPENVNLEATGTLLAVLAMSNPSFATFVNGTTISNSILPDLNVNESGIASWFRIYNRDGQSVIDGDITGQGNGGDLQLENIALDEGSYLALNNFRLRQKS
jgi:hypothetical protein